MERWCTLGIVMGSPMRHIVWGLDETWRTEEQGGVLKRLEKWRGVFWMHAQQKARDRIRGRTQRWRKVTKRDIGWKCTQHRFQSLPCSYSSCLRKSRWRLYQRQLKNSSEKELLWAVGFFSCDVTSDMFSLFICSSFSFLFLFVLTDTFAASIQMAGKLQTTQSKLSVWTYGQASELLSLCCSRVLGLSWMLSDLDSIINDRRTWNALQMERLVSMASFELSFLLRSLCVVFERHLDFCLSIILIWSAL